MFLLLWLYMQQTYFWMKKKIVLFITGCFALLMSSCLGSDNMDYELGKDCQILTFSLSSDSMPELKNVVFTIDQLTGRIFNADSMPFGTVFKDKVICKVQLAPTVFTCQVIQEASAEKDTIFWNLTDSLDFSKPVQFINTLWDGTTNKKYIAQINIHQVVPDSMEWGMYANEVVGGTIKDEKVLVLGNAGAEYYYMYTQPASAGQEYKLYRSSVSDGKNWKELPLSGLPAGEVRLSQINEFEGNLYAVTTKGALYHSSNGQEWVALPNAPSVKALLGSIKADNDFTGSGKQPSALAAVIEKDGALLFAGMNKAMEWTPGAVVNTGFPLNGFGCVSYSSMYRARLLLVAGRDQHNKLTNASWGTEDGRTWVKLSGEETNSFSNSEGVAVAAYDDKFFMVGGINESGKATSDIYLSRDGGVTWSLSDTLVVMPKTFTPRGFSSIHVDKSNFMYLFGGKETTNSNVLDQIWRGRINRLGFKD